MKLFKTRQISIWKIYNASDLGVEKKHFQSRIERVMFSF